mgnify:CR=1 FL=1
MEVRIGSIESARRALSYLREHCRDELSAFDANRVPADVEVGQWGIDLDVVGEQNGIGRFQALFGEIRLLLVGLDAAERLDLAVLLGCAHDVGSSLADFVPEQVDRGQRGTDQIKPNRNAEKRG